MSYTQTLIEMIRDTRPEPGMTIREYRESIHEAYDLKGRERMNNYIKSIELIELIGHIHNMSVKYSQKCRPNEHLKAIIVGRIDLNN